MKKLTTYLQPKRHLMLSFGPTLCSRGCTGGVSGGYCKLGKNDVVSKQKNNNATVACHVIGSDFEPT